MANSRLEKIGTIFTRVTGLLRAGAMTINDKPLWYDVYEAFPPKLEPRFDRVAPNTPIRKIFYNEDLVRAKYHKSLKSQESINMTDTKNVTNCQKFIEIYNDLKEQGPLNDEKIFETAKDILQEQNLTKTQTKSEKQYSEGEGIGLLKSFTDAKKDQAASVNVKDLFKD